MKENTAREFPRDQVDAAKTGTLNAVTEHLCSKLDSEGRLLFEKHFDNYAFQIVHSCITGFDFSSTVLNVRTLKKVTLIGWDSFANKRLAEET